MTRGRGAPAGARQARRDRADERAPPRCPIVRLAERWPAATVCSRHDNFARIRSSRWRRWRFWPVASESISPSFSSLNATLLRPLPIADPGTLVRFDRVAKFFRSNGVPYPATQFIRRHNSVLASVLTCHSSDVVLGQTIDRSPPRLVCVGQLVYGVGLSSAERSLVRGSDGRAGRCRVQSSWSAMSSGGRASSASRSWAGSVRINDRPATIIGVAPPDVPGLRLEDPQVLLLIHQIDRFNPGDGVQGGLGKSQHPALRQAAAPAYRQLPPAKVCARRRRELARLRPQEFQPDEVFQPYSGREGFRSPRERSELRTFALWPASLTLLCSWWRCANLSNMVLSRAINRLRELSVRAALGATRGRLLRQLLIESVVLTALGALGGFLVSHWAVRSAAATPRFLLRRPRASIGASSPRRASSPVVSTIVVGLIPAWMVTRRDLIVGDERRRPPDISRARRGPAARCVLVAIAGRRLLGPADRRRRDGARRAADAELRIADSSSSRWPSWIRRCRGTACRMTRPVPTGRR